MARLHSRERDSGTVIYMRMTGDELLNIDRAQVTRDADGTIRVDDPGSPLAVGVNVDTSTGRARLVRLEILVRETAGLSAATLARLPLQQLVHLAASRVGGGYPEEPFYRQLARPKGRGQRAWDTGHWSRVLAVHEWAESVGRPGGGAQAVADFWGVAKDPTVYRWLGTARQVTA